MLKPLVSKFCSDYTWLFVRFRDIAEKQVPVKLKPIVGPAPEWSCQESCATVWYRSGH